jgi:hypothetical protein
MVAIGWGGCTNDRVLLPGAESSTGEASSGSTSSGSSEPGTTGTTTGLADDTGTASTGEPEVLFVPMPDVGLDDECDLFTQSCPPGLKCMPWANDGSEAWNATACKPLVDDPVGIDEACHVEGSSTSGIDDCARGAMCWDVDPETNQGVCIPFCVGTEDTPICEDPQRACRVVAYGFWLCHPSCDPLDQDCPAGATCLPDSPESTAPWECRPDASGITGAYGDPCEFFNVCDPGLVCASWGAAPGPCEAASGCCTEICDLADPLGAMQCAGAADGQQCLPWYEAGEAPPGYESLGICTLPA